MSEKKIIEDQKKFEENANEIPPRNPLKDVLRTELLPLERFSGKQQGEVLGMETLEGKIAVLRASGRRRYVEIFSDDGSVTEINLDPSVSELAESSKKRGASRINVAREALQMGHGPNHAQKISEVFDRWETDKNSRDYYNNGTDYKDIYNASSQTTSYTGTEGWQEMIVNYDDRKAFGFKNDDTLIVIFPEAVSQKLFVSSDTQQMYSPNLTLDGDMVLYQEKNLFRILDKNGKTVSSFSGTDVTIDPVEPNILYFINTGKVYKFDISGAADRSTQPVLEDQFKLDDPQEIELDPYGNFLIVRTALEHLSVLDRETGEEIQGFSGVAGPIRVNDQADILVVASDKKLRQIQTNFQAIPHGARGKSDEKREQELREMQERFANLNLDKVTKVKKSGLSEDDVKATLRETISKQVTAEIGDSAEPQKIEDVLDRLTALRSDPANQGYEEVIDEFINQGRDKLSAIRIGELDIQLTNFEKSLENVQSVGDTIGMDEAFFKILEFRQKIDITDPKSRAEVEKRLSSIQTKKDALNTQYQGELVEAARETLPAIKELIGETGSVSELNNLSASNNVSKFEIMLGNIKDPEARRQLREEYNSIRAEQKQKLEERNRQNSEQDRLRWAEIVEGAKEDLNNLREQIDSLSDAREIDRFATNPLVTAWRAKLLLLPPELREIEEKKLEIVLGGRKKDMEHRKELGAIGEAGELQFGKARFPIFKELPSLWQPKLTQVEGALEGWAELVFEDQQGRVFRPRGEQQVIVTNDPNDETARLTIERYKAKADEYFKGIKRKVPDYDEHWRITEFHMEKLEEIADALNLQMSQHRGILLLQGEAGTGKNVITDVLANLSNREVIQILCNENSVKEDLTYEFYYNPEKGTYRLPSRLIEGIQKPGTIILFDEINALKPGIAKMLNSLFDYRRRISMPQGGRDQEIITDPTVIFVGTMNPQNYAGVNRLSPEVKSRARVIDLDYPPFEEQRGGRTYFRSDEAEMLAAYMDGLSELKQDEFKKVWDYVINGDTTNGADMIIAGNQEIETDTQRLRDVIRVANRLREMYEAYQIGDSNEPMEFPTSLREVTDIVMEMNHKPGLKDIIKRVIVPKIDDRRQKRMVEETIDAELPDDGGQPRRRPRRA